MWKQIIVDGIKTNYSVSDNGEVRNDVTNKIMKLSLQQGYLHVTLSINNKSRRFRVHRLVALAFIPNPDNKPYVNHINNNRTHNYSENLEWVTPSENTQKAVETGQLQPNRERKVSCYLLDGAFFSDFISLAEAARLTNSSVEKIVLCCQHKRVTHNELQWRYFEEKVDKLQSVIVQNKKKKVGQYDLEDNLLATYNSIAEAARCVNGTASAISRVITGSRQTITHKGYKWKLVEDIVQYE